MIIRCTLILTTSRLPASSRFPAQRLQNLSNASTHWHIPGAIGYRISAFDAVQPSPARWLQDGELQGATSLNSSTSNSHGHSRTYRYDLAGAWVTQLGAQDCRSSDGIYCRSHNLNIRSGRFTLPRMAISPVFGSRFPRPLSQLSDSHFIPPALLATGRQVKYLNLLPSQLPALGYRIKGEAIPNA